MLVLSSSARVPAVVAALVVLLANLGALTLLLRRAGAEDLDRTKLYFATGMLVPLFLWDIPVEFSVPGILLVATVFAFFLYWLSRRIDRRSREASGALPPGLQPLA